MKLRPLRNALLRLALGLGSRILKAGNTTLVREKMSRLAIARMFAFGTFMFLLTAQLTKAQHKPEWTWKDANGERHTRSELDEILRKHGEWIQSYERSGSRANLSGADLSGAYLRGANLSDANLIGANLSNADLRRAVLNRADLSGANLSAADLSSADLSDATLAAAVLDYADLGHAIFEPKLFPELRGIAGAKNLELLTYE